MFRKGIVTEIRGFEIIILLSAYSGKNLPIRSLLYSPRREKVPGAPDRAPGR